jgi:hypothetical protein
MKFPATDIEFAMQAEIDALRDRVRVLEGALREIEVSPLDGDVHAIARRALSQEGGEQVRGCFCHTCGQIMPDTIVTPIPDTPQSVPAWELVPCMDAWCKISPCKCRDGINALIAERDELVAECEAQARLNGMGAERELTLRAERDKLKEEADYASEKQAVYWGQMTKLKMRVSVLERCLRFFASVIKSGEAWTATCEAQYRAALRTSEDEIERLRDALATLRQDGDMLK